MSTLLQQPAAHLDVPTLNWKQDDIEQKIGFRGGRFTSTNKLLTFLISLILSVIWYAILIFGFKPYPGTRMLAGMFLDHQVIPYCVTVMFFWAMTILFIKWRKLVYQRRALDLAAVPRGADFVLDRRTAAEVLKRIGKLVDSPSHFILLNRIERALSNLRNIGNISDVSNLLRTQAEYDEEQISSSYKLVHGFVWATPVLGFIGTVLGLSRAIAGFGDTLRTGTSDVTKLTEALRGTTAGLSTAFEITFLALLATLIIQLFLTNIQHEEANFLDECNNYCHANVVAKLRLSED